MTHERKQKERDNKFEWKKHLAKLTLKRKHRNRQAKESRKKQRDRA